MRKILIVNSSEYSADVLAKFLSRHGYDVNMLTNSTGLLLKMKISQPDLVVLSSSLQNESGYDACRRLKNSAETQYIPVLLVCENDSATSQTRAVESGADDFIYKTEDAPVFLSKTKALLRIKQLSDTLKEQYAALEEKDVLLQAQLSMAKQVQRSLIREYDLTQGGIQILSKYLPAMQIGGDFYDVVPLEDGIVAVAIGDVSGHGISAALLTAMLHMMIINFAPQYYNPAQFLFHMNNAFNDIFEDSGSQMYACIFYAVIDTAKKRVYYSNAGQALPIRYSARSEQCVELDAAGMPIGMMRDTVYDHHIMLYDEGDHLLFYTDGLSDNLYKENAEEFYTRLTTLLSESCAAGLAPEQVLKEMTSLFYKDEWADGVRYELDDVSVILCRM